MQQKLCLLFLSLITLPCLGQVKTNYNNKNEISHYGIYAKHYSTFIFDINQLDSVKINLIT